MLGHSILLPFVASPLDLQLVSLVWTLYAFTPRRGPLGPTIVSLVWTFYAFTPLLAWTFYAFTPLLAWTFYAFTRLFSLDILCLYTSLQRRGVKLSQQSQHFKLSQQSQQSQHFDDF